MNDQERLLAAARRALQAGQRHEARELLQEALRQDPSDYQPWLWLAALASSPRASMDYVRQAEQRAPGDPTVAKARLWALERLAQAEVAEGAAAAPAIATPPAPRQPRRRPALKPTAPVEERRRSRALLFVLSAVAGIALLLVAGAFAWDRFGTPATVAESGDSGEEPSSVIRASTRPSGQFEPRNVLPTRPAATATPTAPTLGLAPKAIAQRQDTAPFPTWTLTPTPTNTPSPTPTVAPTFISGNLTPQPALLPPGVTTGERWIDVNLSSQTLVAYEGTTPVFQSLISSGTWNHPTVTGQFRVYLRFTSQTMDGRRLGYNYYLENVPYVMYFYEDYALHGTFWHNNFGTPMSHGCVNLPTPAAQWIFEWSTMGTLVNVHY